MKVCPPKWADRFLEWYCNPQLLEEIQGDAHELHCRIATGSKLKADLYFIWIVIRFFRWKNIRRSSTKHVGKNNPLGMVRNIFLVALRNFFRQPGHSLLNLLGLTVGFVCAFLILLWVTFEFSFDRFHQNSDKIFKVVTHVEGEGDVQTYDVASAIIDVSSIPEVDKLVSVCTGERWPNVMCFKPEGKSTDCVYLNGVYANENLFSVFNFPIVSGDQNPLHQPANIAISEKMSRLLFNTDNAIGKTMKINSWHEVTVVSVFKDVPQNSSLKFDFALPFSVLIKVWGGNVERFNENFFDTYLKTHGEISSSELTGKLNHISVITEKNKSDKVSYQAIPFMDSRLKNKFQNGRQAGGRIEYVILFMVIGSLVIIMAIINFINLTTARASTRAKEIGIRKVIGAYRSGIMLQFMAESFLTVLVAFTIAVFITQLALPYFSIVLGEPIDISILDGSIPIYLSALLIFISIAAGIYPAFVLSSFQPVKVLKGQFASQPKGSQRLRKSLLVLQLSVSIGIIIFSSVLYLQLNYVTQKNLGFDRSNMIRIEPTGDIYRNFDKFKNELFKNPSIISVGTSNSNPLNSAGGNNGITWPGKPNGLRVNFKTIACSYEFPETIGLKVIEGRGFQSEPMDSLKTEVLVTEDAVKRMNLKQPIGESIKIGEVPCVIVGVVNDFHTESLHESRLPTILYRSNYMQTSAIYVKYQPGTTQPSFDAIDHAYRDIEKTTTMRYWFQDDTFNEIYKTEITASRLVLLFTTIALIIACVGIVGLATYNVHLKTKEIGIRRLLGASVSQIMTILTAEFVWVMCIAIILASPLAWIAAQQWLTGFAYHIAMPWWIYVATFAGIALVTLSIICLQGLKTAVTNPTETLRSE